MITKLITSGYNLQFHDGSIIVTHNTHNVTVGEITNLLPELLPGEVYTYNYTVIIDRF
jgi:hypothetical protein